MPILHSNYPQIVSKWWRSIFYKNHFSKFGQLFSFSGNPRARDIFLENIFIEYSSPPSILNIFDGATWKWKKNWFCTWLSWPKLFHRFRCFLIFFFEKKSECFRKGSWKIDKRWNRRFGHLFYVRNQLIFHLQVVPSKIWRIEGKDIFSEKMFSKNFSCEWELRVFRKNDSSSFGDYLG